MTERRFRKIIAGTKKAVLGAIRAHLSPALAHAVDDVAQETYIRIYRALKKGSFSDDPNKLSSWAYVIARNECYRMNGKEVRNQKRENAAADLMLLQQWQQDDSLESFMDLEEMESRLAVLEEPFRSTVAAVLEGYTLAEVAARMNVALGTIKSRLHRARERLRSLAAEEAEPAMGRPQKQGAEGG